MERVGTEQTAKLTLEFVHLPAYARYLLENRLEDFVSVSLRSAFELDIPILRAFRNTSYEQLFELSLESNRKLFGSIASGRHQAHVEELVANWMQNQLPVITRDQVLAEDITLSNYIRRHGFRMFLADYTDDQRQWLDIMSEVDRLTVQLDNIFLNACLQIQQERIDVATRALQKRETQLLEAQRLGNTGSFEWDIVSKKAYCSPQVIDIFELTEEVLGNIEAFIPYIHPDDAGFFRSAVERSFETGVFECEYRYCAPSREKYILTRAKVTFSGSCPVAMVGTIMDITERQNIIRRLEEAESLNKQAQAITHLGNWFWNVQTGDLMWSDELYRIFGLEPQSEKMTIDRFLAFIDPARRDEAIAAMQRGLAGGEGSEVYFHIVTADGRRKVLNSKAEFVRNAAGDVIQVVGTAQDVTKEHRLTEKLRDREQYLNELNRSLEKKNEELIGKNKELESFNFIASHDLQEPLRKIRIYANRILTHPGFDPPDDVRNHFGRIHTAAARMQKLIDDFLAFSHTLKGAPNFEVVSLDDLADEVHGEFQLRLSERNATLTTDKLPEIEAIRFQLKQLLVNLFSNSLKYARPDVRLTIAVKCRATGADANGVNWYEISVSDNGIGFDQKYADKIFELFQRLHKKDQYSGTGIGLALCKKICENHGGSIRAVSEPMKGTTFLILLPERQHP